MATKNLARRHQAILIKTVGRQVDMPVVNRADRRALKRQQKRLTSLT